MRRSRVGQIEAALDTLDAQVHPIKPVRHIGVLVLKTADTLLYLANIVAHVVDRATDVTQRFKNDVVRFGHDVRLSRCRRVVNRDGLLRIGIAMKKRKLPRKFKLKAEERKFWETHDSTDYIDWSKGERVRFPNLKPSTTAISIRLPLGLLEQIKIAANKRDVPYQSLIDRKSVV
jgi:predicted DNA binding CopG/RHH family protein